jgi:hypothetical protein
MRPQWSKRCVQDKARSQKSLVFSKFGNMLKIFGITVCYCISEQIHLERLHNFHQIVFLFVLERDLLEKRWRIPTICVQQGSADNGVTWRLTDTG